MAVQFCTYLRCVRSQSCYSETCFEPGKHMLHAALCYCMDSCAPGKRDGVRHTVRAAEGQVLEAKFSLVGQGAVVV